MVHSQLEVSYSITSRCKIVGRDEFDIRAMLTTRTLCIGDIVM